MMIGVLGASGKTGSQVVALLPQKIEFTSTSGFKELDQCDVVIDFSTPSACLEAMKQSGSPACWVIGSTGWTKDQEKELHALSQKHLILKSANFSLGMALYLEILKSTASEFKKMGFKADLIETHHLNKKDAPSGTALMIQNELKNCGIHLDPIQSIRKGDEVGTHSLTFQVPYEKLTLTHQAIDRRVFASGAIQAAQWLVQLYKSNSMRYGLLSLSDFFKKS